ncbi:MAG: hypothetical protein GY768_27885 [Planctomycetaceae bacterium]|nr:hypothetical protein [Planctomycetaceae bacterium]
MIHLRPIVGHSRIRQLLFFLSCFFVVASSAPAADFPAKPIKIIVYTGPGGLIDTTARKFTEIAEKYVDATIIVENKPGAGGIVAMEKVIQLPADGYTLYACTKSNIAKIVSSNRTNYIDDFDWIAMLMADPECIITRANDPRSNWSTLVEDARSRPGKQVWLGPAFGGLDHVMALKTWNKFDISARWIPFGGGGVAKAALLGDQGVAYVGNPRDAAGNPELKISVISNPTRLPQYPNTPIFSDFGVEGLDREFMWRGFAIKSGVPSNVLAWYRRLFRKVNQDSDWREFWERDGIEVVYYDEKKFTPIIESDRDEFEHYLSILQNAESPDLEQGVKQQSESTNLLMLLLAILANGLIAIGLIFTGKSARLGYILIPSFTLSIAVLFFTAAMRFPRTDDVGAAAVPQLWSVLIVPFALLLIFQTVRNHDRITESKRIDLVWKFAALLAAYMAIMIYTGYYLGSFVFLLVAMWMLGLNRFRLALGVTLAWLVFAYLAFARMLYVPLPIGRLFEPFL